MSNISDNVEAIPMQNPPNGQYGAEVEPNGPLQDMYASIDTIAGGPTPQVREAPPSGFGAGVGPMGIGGHAEPPSPIADPLGGPQQDVP